LAVLFITATYGYLVFALVNFILILVRRETGGIFDDAFSVPRLRSLSLFSLPSTDLLSCTRLLSRSEDAAEKGRQAVLPMPADNQLDFPG
jgi:hypothetical protein